MSLSVWVGFQMTFLGCMLSDEPSVVPIACCCWVDGAGFLSLAPLQCLMLARLAIHHQGPNFQMVFCVRLDREVQSMKPWAVLIGSVSEQTVEVIIVGEA